jgi:hypothetical protein
MNPLDSYCPAILIPRVEGPTFSGDRRLALHENNPALKVLGQSGSFGSAFLQLAPSSFARIAFNQLQPYCLTPRHAHNKTFSFVAHPTILPFYTRYNFCVMEPRTRSKCRFPEWQPEYEAVIAETDVEELKVKTAALEEAIFNRCQTIAGRLGYETERDAIQLAIDTLRDIQKTKLGYPPWKQCLKRVVNEQVR